MAIDTSEQALSELIDSLRSDYLGYAAEVRQRNQEYLRTVSPPFDSRLGEHDQWRTPVKESDKDHVRSSFNETRAVVETWASLEAGELPTLRWLEDFLPVPAPSMDAAENAQREEVYRATKLVNRQTATVREQTLSWHLRRAKFERHWYRTIRKKNEFGHAWLRVLPVTDRQTFECKSSIDPSTVYPVWAIEGDRALDMVLVAYRKSARLAARQYPAAKIAVDRNGAVAEDAFLYIPTAQPETIDLTRKYVWIEDLWLVDPEYQDTEGEEPATTAVINAIRVNGKIVAVTPYPGWRTVPYFLAVNEDDRTPLGHSDAADMQPYQDSYNRTLSQQQDVIYGESRPKFKFRSDSGRSINVQGEEVVALEPDEDIEQITVALNAWPAQTHIAELRQSEGRVTGLPATIWGEITSAQNSGRALSTAWKATAVRMIPRNFSNEETLENVYNFMLDCMELYDWSSAPAIYRGNRDYELDFPNQEPRDPNEVTLDAINQLQAGIVDLQGAMELKGEKSPDEMLERVRADYMDAVLHPEKAQAYKMLARLDQQTAIEAQQAGMQAQAAAAQLAAMKSTPPGGAPSGANVDQQARAAAQARAQAAAQGAPRMGPEQGAPAAQAGSPANAGQRAVQSTMLQNGEASSRAIVQGPF